MRVLFVSGYGPWRKPNPFIEAQSNSLKDAGLDVTDFYVAERGIMGNIKGYFQLKQFLKQNDPFDVIHCHFCYTALLVYLAQTNSKRVLSFMGTDLMGSVNKKGKIALKGRFNKLLSQFIQSKMHVMIVKSESMLLFINPKFHSITHVIPNGIDLKKFRAIDKKAAREKLSLNLKKKYVLFLGDPRSPVKNFKMLKEAFSKIKDEDVELLCPYPVASNDVMLYLNACDVLAFSSLQEGSPNIIKEALACNCPVVATNVGDVGERIGNVRGCYISSFETDDFSNKLKEALRLDKRTNGRASILHLDSEKVALRIKQVYEGNKPAAV